MTATVLDGKACAAEVEVEIAAQVAELDLQPHLAVVIVGDDPASHVYVSGKERACARVGIRSTRIDMPADADFSQVSANEWLIQHAPYTGGDIGFSAMNADARLAELLDASEGSALFVVDRITWDKDTPVTSVRLSYAPGYRMNTKI